MVYVRTYTRSEHKESFLRRDLLTNNNNIYTRTRTHARTHHYKI